MHRPTPVELTHRRGDSRQHPLPAWTPRTPKRRSLCIGLVAASAACLVTFTLCLAPAQAQDKAAPPLPHAAAATEGAEALHLWHAVARAAIVRQRPNQQAALRVLALLATAQHGAAEAFAAGGSAPDEAWRALFDVVSAGTLAGLMPAERETFERLVGAQAATRRGGTPAADVERAEQVARTAVEDTLRRAAADRFEASADVRLPDDPATWRSQFQPARPPHLPRLGQAAPIFLRDGAALRPPAPPAVGSPAFDAAVAEVRARVERAGPPGLERARRWEMVTGSLVAGFWGETAARLALQHGLPGRLTSRMLAASLGATWDANIACHDAKYVYWTPRPSQVDPGIKPLVGLPNHPSYPSNHGCDSAAAAEVLAAYFPARSAELRSMAREAGESRIDGGIHYRFDVEAGLAIGRGAAAAALSALGPAQAVAGAGR